MKFVEGITFEKYLNDIYELKINTFNDFKRTMQLFRIMYLLYCKTYRLNAAGIVHHDLNLGNILITFDDDDYVVDINFIDFGQAMDTNYIFQDIYKIQQNQS